MQTGAEILIQALEREGAELVFAYPGGASLEIFDCLRQSSIKTVLVRHEQGAAHEASGYARASGKPGVCIATSGPGATNLVTGIAAACMDSVPMVIITGQVFASMVGTDAFQEVDVTGITDPITKHNYFVKDVNAIAQTVREAFYIATSGRPGPVLIDLPRDVAMEASGTVEAAAVRLRGYKPNLKGHAGQIKQVLRLLDEAERPVIIAGGGVIGSGSWSELARLAHTQQIPVANTLMGLGSIPWDDPLALGMAGVHGLAPANLAIQRSDLLIGLGVRFSERLTGSIGGFAPHAKIIHIDVDPAEIGKNLRVDVPLVGDLKIVLNQLLEKLAPAERPNWLAEIAGLRSTPAPGSKLAEGLSPITVLEALGRVMPEDTVVTTDVGQHQMWAAQRLPHRYPRHFISSGGLGAMGYGLPAAIGAKLACPDKTVLCVTGDGSFQMGLPELGTAKEQKLAIKILLINNDSLGLVRQLQDYYSGQRHSAVYFADNPDFGVLIKAYGGRYYPVTDEKGLVESLHVFLADPGLALLEAKVSAGEDVLPAVLQGNALDVMEGA
ncbi:MAG: biosynthetic-type acetolactate synthase large subunit [Clostridiales bacterium]|nr:biosynthetic-type acetolactate synthase large subunit [Clostridiales bacterium]